MSDVTIVITEPPPVVVHVDPPTAVVTVSDMVMPFGAPVLVIENGGTVPPGTAAGTVIIEKGI